MRRTKNMSEKTLYQQLAEEIGDGESKLMPKIFETLIDDTEAKVLLAAAPPATVDEISKKSGVPKEDIEKMIDPLFKRGLIFKSKKKDALRYYRVRSVPQFHDSTAVMLNPSREMLDLWKEYMETDWHQYSRKLEETLPGSVVRVIPVNVSVEPGSQILVYDDIKTVIDNAKNLAVTPCSCRVIDGKCEKPLEVCVQVNRAADYAIERGTGRQLNKKEALELMKMCEEEGLVHCSDNRQEVGHVICNCCEDCCLNWTSLRTGLKKFTAPSRFCAEVDPDLCSECETCLDRCYFDAITMEEDTAVIDPENCMGCGLCLVTCPDEAIRLNEVRPQDFIPA
jgi:NAD-dependent dihydropyrimidine dehydrogenase PreA subunit/DNA-binding MarR family transcriptional regulator